jgi:transcriptional regulator with XRE-family HTH domain
MADLKQLGKRIKEARQRSGLSQQKLSSIVGVSDKTISAYEVGRVEPPLDALEKIGSATNHPLAFFVGNVQSGIEARLDKIARELAELRRLMQEER